MKNIQESFQLKKTSDKDNWSLAGKLTPKTRIFAPVVVRGQEDQGVRLWGFGITIYKALLALAEGDFMKFNFPMSFSMTLRFFSIWWIDVCSTPQLKISKTFTITPEHRPQTDLFLLFKMFASSLKSKSIGTFRKC